MTRQQRREAIKRVYPLACAGDFKAIKDLAELTRPGKHKARCWVCGVPVLTYLPHGQEARCMVHRKTLLSMKSFRVLPIII